MTRPTPKEVVLPLLVERLSRSQTADYRAVVGLLNVWDNPSAPKDLRDLAFETVTRWFLGLPA